MRQAVVLLAAAWVVGCDGRTQGGILHKKVDKEDIEGIRKEVAAGADINAKGGGGQTPLMMATLSGKTECVKVLLELGADIEIGEKDGYTPIHGAGFQGRPEIAKILIDHGANPADVHKDGYQPIHRALWGSEPRHTRTVQTFLEAGIPWDLTLLDGRTLLDIVNKRTNKNTYQLLLGYKEAAEQAALEKEQRQSHEDEL